MAKIEKQLQVYNYESGETNPYVPPTLIRLIQKYKIIANVTATPLLQKTLSVVFSSEFARKWLLEEFLKNKVSQKDRLELEKAWEQLNSQQLFHFLYKNRAPESSSEYSFLKPSDGKTVMSEVKNGIANILNHQVPLSELFGVDKSPKSLLHGSNEVAIELDKFNGGRYFLTCLEPEEMHTYLGPIPGECISVYRVGMEGELYPGDLESHFINEKVFSTNMHLNFNNPNTELFRGNQRLVFFFECTMSDGTKLPVLLAGHAATNVRGNEPLVKPGDKIERWTQIGNFRQGSAVSFAIPGKMLDYLEVRPKLATKMTRGVVLDAHAGVELLKPK